MTPPKHILTDKELIELVTCICDCELNTKEAINYLKTFLKEIQTQTKEI